MSKLPKAPLVEVVFELKWDIKIKSDLDDFQYLYGDLYANLKYIPTKERMNLTEYYGQPGDGEMAVVLGTEIMEERALMSGDQIYLPLDMVNTYLNQRYYWDSLPVGILFRKFFSR